MNTKMLHKRYSEAELAEFKIHIEKKLEKTQEQLVALEEQLTNTAESKDNEGDWMDDSTANIDMEMLEVMANRQRVHLLDLQNALQRIHNKSYGICIITGELIDKKRLMAVPTTTKSLAAKMDKEISKKKPVKRAITSTSSEPKIISKIIRKPEVKPIKPQNWEEEEEEDLDDLLEEDLDMPLDVDLDNFSEEDLD